MRALVALGTLESREGLQRVTCVEGGWAWDLSVPLSSLSTSNTPLVSPSSMASLFNISLLFLMELIWLSPTLPPHTHIHTFTYTHALLS